MKKYICAAMLLLGLSIIGCQKEEPKQEPGEDAGLFVSPTSLSFDNGGGSQTLTIKTSLSWTLSSSQSWCKVSKSSGNATGTSFENVSVTCEANTSYDDRSCTLTVKVGSLMQTVDIKQGKVNGLVISQDSYDVSNEAQSIEVEVKANVEYEYAIAEDAKEWITAAGTKALESSKIKFDIAANESYEKREGIITFSYLDYSCKVVISQFGKDLLILSKHSYEIPSDGGIIELEVNSTIGEPQICIPDEVDWIEDVTTKAVLSYKRNLMVSRNRDFSSRSAIIIVSNEDGTLRDSASIVQSQFDTLFVDNNKLYFPPEGGEKSLSITTNTEYSITTTADWLSTSLEKGETQDKLTVVTQENKSNSARETSLIISYGSKYVEVLISQSASEDTYWGNVILNTLDDVESFGRRGYRIINGNFTSKVSMQKLCNTIEHIEGDVSLTLGYNIKNCDGLYGLKSIGGSFNLDLPLDHLNYGIMTEGLNNIQSIGNNFNLTFTSKNGRAECFEGLDELKTIGGDFNLVLKYGTLYNSINTYGGLTFNGFNSLKNIDGSFILKKDRREGVEHINLQSFMALTSIGGDLIFENIVFDKSADNLSYLNNVSGNVSISNCRNEFSVAKNLQIVGNDVFIEHSNDAYPYFEPDSDSINMLSSITSIGGNLKLIINDAIKSIDAFRSLSSVKGDVYVDINHTYIESLCFRKIESMKSCWITSSKPTSYGYYISLNSIQFPSLNKVDNDFVIGGSKYYYNDMEHYNQLKSDNPTGIELLCPKLESVGGNFYLTNFRGFSDSSDLSKLKTVGALGFDGQHIAKVFFKNAESFISIKGGDLILLNTYIKNDELHFFNKIDDSLRNVEIIDNPSLSDFSPLVPIVTNMTGDWIVLRCAYNPTKYQMLNGQSKPSE